MEIKKSYWTTNGETINLAVPFVKVDKQKRVVSGFATLDNVDKHGDIVDTMASMNAFARFRGNIREMHQPIAVGKVVSFRQEDFYDKKTQKTYSGVFVDVYVSKGAADTWEKVLDGTLSGFSIGGSINKSDTVNAHDDYEGPVRIIKDYDLVELSLVDNPANQFANVFSIQKNDIGFKVTGMATEIKASTVFYCDTDEIAVTSNDAQKSCTICDSAMTNIGWVEEGSDTKSADISAVVSDYVKKNTVSEGGIEVTEELDAKVEETAVEEAVEEAAAEEAVEAAEETIEKSADEPEAEVAEEAPAEQEVEDDNTIEKMLDGIKSYISEAISKAADNTPSVDDIMNQLMGQINTTKAEMTEKYDAMNSAIAKCMDELSGMKNRMDAYEAATAVKKSSDFEAESVEPLKKQSIWKGHFLGVSDI